jgi:two-component system nitrogen regulation sensor histidine kinase NtrY
VLRQDGQTVRVSVIDDGVGLPADRVRLTEPYVTHKPKGTGLGLAIVKKIMEDHGGSLALDDRPGGASTTPGAVATLVIPLPCPDARVVAGDAPGEAPDFQNRSGNSPVQAEG